MKFLLNNILSFSLSRGYVCGWACHVPGPAGVTAYTI